MNEGQQQHYLRQGQIRSRCCLLPPSSSPRKKSAIDLLNDQTPTAMGVCVGGRGVAQKYNKKKQQLSYSYVKSTQATKPGESFVNLDKHTASIEKLLHAAATCSFFFFTAFCEPTKKRNLYQSLEQPLSLLNIKASELPCDFFLICFRLHRCIPGGTL